MRRRWKDEEPRGDKRWLLTYLDMCTLLFAFFVLLVSMSSIDTLRQKRALGSIENSFGREMAESRAGSDGSRRGAGPDKASPSAVAGEGDVEGRDAASRPEVLKKNDQVIIELRRSVLFDTGSYAISGRIQPYLGELAEHLKGTEGEVDINGHTDMTEGTGEGDARARSWETSMKRAEAVYRYLEDKGVNPGRMRFRGFSHYQPAESVQGSASSIDRNARVDVVLAPGVALPRSLQPAGTGSGGPVNYKNFFFKLFPVSPKETDGVGEKGGAGHGKPASS